MDPYQYMQYQQLHNYYYSLFLSHSKGVIPTYEQFHLFINNMIHLLGPLPPPEFIPLEKQENKENKVINEIRIKCVKMMACKDVFCKNYHHPGLDPDIFYNKSNK